MQTVTTSTFFDQELLETDYFRLIRRFYETCPDRRLINKYRCFPIAIRRLQSIFDYNKVDGLYFARRIKQQQSDTRSCEAVISEVIVYSHYLQLIEQGVVKSVSRREDDYDLKIERSGFPDIFLEVFCLMPEFKENKRGVYDILTHTQEACSSVRQKLLHKIHTQNQMQKPRSNWAVIELNDCTIAGDFAVLSSLSDGYKLTFELGSNKFTQSGYDWSKSLFDLPETKSLHGVIYFSLGCYEDRRRIINTRVAGHQSEESLRVP
jgi:hypothetical protein